MTSHNSTPPPYDRYGSDVLSNNPHTHSTPSLTPSTRIQATPGLLIEDVHSGFVGEIMKVSKVAGQWIMILEGRGGTQRSFPMGTGYWIDGQPVDICPPTPSLPQERRVAGHRITASGSLHTAHRARIARESRIWVEGKHDAQLVSKIWGEDLAYVGVVIEELAGIDNLNSAIDDFQPHDTRRAGILVDHIVSGSKESRIAAQLAGREGVLILGHPYVDVWQAIKPSVLGFPAWPTVPRGEDIKLGTMKRLGWLTPLRQRAHNILEERGAVITPATVDTTAIGLCWTHILSKVTTYKDIEPSLLGRMEELIDFVTAQPS